MNASNFAHVLLAVIAQCVIATVVVLVSSLSVTTGLTMGALFAVAFYWGREVAQAERVTGTPPCWSGFDFTRWSVDGILDLACPTLAVTIVVVLGEVLA